MDGSSEQLRVRISDSNTLQVLSLKVIMLIILDLVYSCVLYCVLFLVTGIFVYLRFLVYLEIRILGYFQVFVLSIFQVPLFFVLQNKLSHLFFFLQNKISHFFFANNGFARVVNCKCKHAAVLVSSAVTVLHLLIFVFCLYFSFWLNKLMPFRNNLNCFLIQELFIQNR